MFGELYMNGVKMGDIHDAKLESESEPEYFLDGKSKEFKYRNHEAALTMDLDIKPEKVEKILGLDCCHAPDSYCVQFSKLVQARKHKKKRINKKWLKKYGYKTVNFMSEGWRFKAMTDGTFEFIKKMGGQI